MTFNQDFTNQIIWFNFNNILLAIYTVQGWAQART